MTIHRFTFRDWSWSAVFAGVVASLVFQVLLVMVGFGFGLLTIDVPTADSAPKAVSWAVFTWWAVSGVISAFVGGWVAANFSDAFTSEGRATHGLMAWAIATLIVVGTFGCFQLGEAHVQALEAKRVAEQERDQAREVAEEAKAEVRKERAARRKIEETLQQYGRAPGGGPDKGPVGSRPMGG